MTCRTRICVIEWEFLSVNSNKHYRRPNNWKYRKDSDSGTDYYYKNGPGRRLKAVASHSPHAQPNTKAYSRHIPNEAAMHHTERKSFKLPCKYTIAASWAALRKAWLGFKIANSNDDIQKKRHYSRIIREDTLWSRYFRRWNHLANRARSQSPRGTNEARDWRWCEWFDRWW